MITTFCIYNQYKIKHVKNARCWLCGNINEKCTEYETIFGNYINLHPLCFERQYHQRREANYIPLSITKNEDYHCLQIRDFCIVYNTNCLKFLSYKKDEYVAYPNSINDNIFNDTYKNWSLKYLVNINIPKLLYFKKYLKHNDIYTYIKMIYSVIIIY